MTAIEAHRCVSGRLVQAQALICNKHRTLGQRENLSMTGLVFLSDCLIMILSFLAGIAEGCACCVLRGHDRAPSRCARVCVCLCVCVCACVCVCSVRVCVQREEATHVCAALVLHLGASHPFVTCFCS